VLWTINALTRDLVFDVRRHKEFAEKHIHEAINLGHEAIGTETERSKNHSLLPDWSSFWPRTGCAKKRGFIDLENYGGIDHILAHLKKKRKNSADHLASF
jgi:rhodanese-related sulfurtransferase